MMFKVQVMTDRGTEEFGVIVDDRDRDTGSPTTNISRQIGNPKLFETYESAKAEADAWAARKYLNHLAFVVNNA